MFKVMCHCNCQYSSQPVELQFQYHIIHPLAEVAHIPVVVPASEYLLAHGTSRFVRQERVAEWKRKKQGLHAVDVMFVLFSAIVSALCHLLESYFLKWRVHFSLKSLVEVWCLEGGGTAPSSVSHGKLGATSLTTWVEEGLAIYTNERWLNYELYLLPWVPILLHDSKSVCFIRMLTPWPRAMMEC